MAGMPSMGQIWLLLFVVTAGLVFLAALIAALIALARYREPSRSLSAIGLKGYLLEVVSLSTRISSALVVVFFLTLALTLAT